MKGNNVSDTYNTKPEPTTFRDELKNLLNRFNRESNSDTPDFILADYLQKCLIAFDNAVKWRDHWYKQENGHAIPNEVHSRREIS
jgi:hypothetical protein